MTGAISAAVFAPFHIAPGQQIVGTVRSAVADTPVPGAVVFVLAANDSITARTVSDSRGRFALSVSRRFADRLRVIRIGFQPKVVRIGEDDSFAIRLTRLPSLLDTVRLTDRNDCPTSGNAREAVAMWEQARAALLAATLTRESNPPVMRVIQYDRVLRPLSSAKTAEASIDIDSQTTRVTNGVGARVFAGTRSAEEVAEQGYRVQSDSGYTLYPPDEITLLDDAFVRRHCFQVRHDGDKHPGQLGIAFAPVTDGVKVDVRGTLWIDSSVAALHLLEFSFTGMPNRNAVGGGPGGFLEFEDAPSGTPLLTRWGVSQPRPIKNLVADLCTSRSTCFAAPPRLQAGDQLAEVTWADGTVWAARLPSIEGIVVDPATHRPRLDIPIELLNAGLSTRTDSAGRFAFKNIMDGPYILAVVDTLSAVFQTMLKSETPRILWANERALPQSRSREQAVSPLERRLNVARNSNPSIRVELPSIDDAFRRSCGKGMKGDSSGVLALWTLKNELPGRGVRVGARWQEGTVPIERTVKTDDQGRAIICGVPISRDIRLSATRDGGASTEAQVTIEPAQSVLLVIIREQE